jgi:hypothetical protein
MTPYELVLGSKMILNMPKFEEHKGNGVENGVHPPWAIF